MTTESHPNGWSSSGSPASPTRDTTGQLLVSAMLPADPERLQVARGLASTLGVALDFDIDTIADLRMAVDEMVSMLITRSAGDGAIELSLLAEADEIEARARASVIDAEPFDESSLGWSVLTALVRDLDVDIDPTPGGATIDIRLTVVADRGGS